MHAHHPILETDHLVMRFPTAEDAAPISKLANNPHIAHMVAQVKSPYTLDDAQQWFELIQKNHDHFLHITFILCLKGSGKVVGTCGATHIKQQTYGLGYWVGEDYWHNGYATEAVKTLVDFLIKKREAKYISAWYANENLASKRVLEKSGLSYNGKQQDIHSIGRGCDVPCSLMEMDLKSQR